MDEEELKAIAELKAMSFEELQLVDHEKLKWICSGKGCCRSTKVYDFGIIEIYHPKMKPQWMNRHLYYFLCPKHNKMYKRLIKNYPVEKVRDKLCNFDKERFETINKNL